MALQILHGGLLTTVQDRGRTGHQAEGVPVGGPMDPLALRCANLLVGNPPDAAVLEITLVGPAIRFAREALIAIAGADLDASIDGHRLPAWHAAIIAAGATLTFRGAPSGCYTYLAIAGGVDVPLLMGSRSTYQRAAFGGHEGRALRAGDELGTLEPGDRARQIARAIAAAAGPGGVSRWGVGPSVRALFDDPIRLIEGRHAALLTDAARARLFGESFRLSTQSDRMGYRLSGVTLELRAPTELLSDGVTFGTVQLPPGGDPIVLMADRQTTGGYPRIGEVATVDLRRLAQRRPGVEVRFAPVGVAEAQSLHEAQEAELELLARSIALRAR